jgi:hypothetical protein
MFESEQLDPPISSTGCGPTQPLVDILFAGGIYVVDILKRIVTVVPLPAVQIVGA